MLLFDWIRKCVADGTQFGSFVASRLTPPKPGSCFTVGYHSLVALLTREKGISVRGVDF